MSSQHPTIITAPKATRRRRRGSPQPTVRPPASASAGPSAFGVFKWDDPNCIHLPLPSPEEAKTLPINVLVGCVPSCAREGVNNWQKNEAWGNAARVAAARGRTGVIPRPQNNSFLHKSHEKFVRERMGGKCPKGHYATMMKRVWDNEPPEVKEHFTRLFHIFKLIHEYGFLGYIYTPRKKNSRASEDSQESLSGQVQMKSSVDKNVAPFVESGFSVLGQDMCQEYGIPFSIQGDYSVQVLNLRVEDARNPSSVETTALSTSMQSSATPHLPMTSIYYPDTQASDESQFSCSTTADVSTPAPENQALSPAHINTHPLLEDILSGINEFEHPQGNSDVAQQFFPGMGAQFHNQVVQRFPTSSPGPQTDLLALVSQSHPPATQQLPTADADYLHPQALDHLQPGLSRLGSEAYAPLPTIENKVVNPIEAFMHSNFSDVTGSGNLNELACLGEGGQASVHQNFLAPGDTRILPNANNAVFDFSQPYIHNNQWLSPNLEAQSCTERTRLLPTPFLRTGFEDLAMPLHSASTLLGPTAFQPQFAQWNTGFSAPQDPVLDIYNVHGG